MARLLGVIAAISGWLGWLTLAPALGVPSLATAAMVNRVLAPREDPGYWLGWAVLLIALVSAALVYLVAVDRGLIRTGVATGAAYGALCWLLVGAVLMPLLGLVAPATSSGPSGPADPMQGSFMMLHLGIAAPIAALVAWSVFGMVLGSTSGSNSSKPSLRMSVPSWRGQMTEPVSVRSVLGVAALAAITIVAVGWAVGRMGVTWSGSARMVGQPFSGPVQSLPKGAVFVSMIELPQAAGSVLGPHAHVPGFAWSLRGVETINFHDGGALRIGPGEAGFMAAGAVHSHVNADDRLPAAALALVILVLTALTALLALRASRTTGRLVWAVLPALVATGMLGLWNPWSNDWLFISIRPAAARGAAMPLPSASRVYESPDLGALPPGPYVETVEEIGLPPRGQAQVGSSGAVVLLVLEGRIGVPSANGSTSTGTRDAILVQPGASLAVTNPGDGPARLLKFALTPSSPEA